MWGYCATGGGSRGAGVFGPLGTTVQVTLQEKAGRPMGPSTLQCEFPWELVDVHDRLFLLALQVVVCYNVELLFFLRG